MRLKRVIFSLLIVLSISTLTVLTTEAFFSDTETSRGNVLSAGSIDLRIDNESYYNLEPSESTSWELSNLDDGNGPAEGGEYLFFNFHDLKPGDLGEDTISMHVDNNSAWACMDLSLTQNDDNGSTEPELESGDEEDGDSLFDGELAQELNFVFWADDGDNVLENDEYVIKEGTGDEVLNTTLALADSTVNVWDENQESSPIQGSTEPEGNVYHVGKAWCYGELTKAPVEQGDNDPTQTPGVVCNGALVTNQSQTDMLETTLEFRAVQSRNNNSFECIGCEESGTGNAVDAVSYNPGPTEDGGSVPSGRNNPDAATGPADGNFVSLGFGGEVVLELAGPITGSDLSVIEVTFGRDGYPDETADVYVGSSATGPWSLAGNVSNHDDSGVATVDVSSHSNVKYVRIVDTSDTEDFSGQPDADGFDLDAVETEVCFDERPIDEPDFTEEQEV